MKIATAAVTAAALFAAAPVLAGVPAPSIWNETVDGDLSNDGLNTTDLGTLGLGAGTVTGSMGSGAEFDPDYFTFTIAAGQQLDSIDLISYATGDGTTGRSFIALQEGPQITTEFDATIFLGSTLVGTAEVGQDILDDIGLDLFGDGPGFTGPLGEGTYSIWWQETANTIDYTFQFNVSAVPAPAGLAALGLGGLVATRRRR